MFHRFIVRAKCELEDKSVTSSYIISIRITNVRCMEGKKFREEELISSEDQEKQDRPHRKKNNDKLLTAGRILIRGYRSSGVAFR